MDIVVSPGVLPVSVLHGSRTFSSVVQADCARFVVDHKLPLGSIFTHRFALDEATEAYRVFDTQTTGKGVFLLE